MHDLHAADLILKLVLEKAAENKIKEIKKIVIELGSVVEHSQEINPENLAYNLKLLASQTPAKMAEIEIRPVAGSTWKLVEIEGE
ncbi:MAG: hydrogenase/urease maturation nickel metallochaperone HypA [Candidatus Buchananbacteria bacterium]